MQKLYGFTLIELIIVIIVITVLSTYALFSWPNLTVNLTAQAEQVANDLRYTQSLSMTKGTRYQFVILTSTTYQIQNKSTSSPIILASGNTTETLNSGITLSSYTTGTIIFDGEGIPYNSSGTALTSNATITLSGNGQTHIVTITPLTGVVTVQ